MAERHDVVAYEGLLQAFDERGLSRAGSSGDSDNGNFHSVGQLVRLYKEKDRTFRKGNPLPDFDYASMFA